MASWAGSRVRTHPAPLYGHVHPIVWIISWCPHARQVTLLFATVSGTALDVCWTHASLLSETQEWVAGPRPLCVHSHLRAKGGEVTPPDWCLRITLVTVGWPEGDRRGQRTGRRSGPRQRTAASQLGGELGTRPLLWPPQAWSGSLPFARSLSPQDDPMTPMAVEVHERRMTRTCYSSRAPS